MLATFKDDEEIIDLVRRFESCEINPADFRHYQHLTVALWYLKEFPYDIASDKLRAGIRKLAAAYGKTGYHETITLFWLMVVRDFVATADSGESISESANQLVSTYQKSLIAEYYSEELIASPEAKHRWVEPDLKSFSLAMKSVPSA
ncbi:MAG TPA: hypothetical protein VHQ64_00475 [Pyrinomonadaceae bacterium]|jgi:hypothetical protein|nr:hypothetical protein [Pyrinomonadaceae bacterium]